MNNVNKRNCYTYLIGWSKYKIYYYGRRTAKGCSPKELWVTYFTSSKYVKQFRQDVGNPDIIQIRKTFGNNIKLCEKWEYNVIERLKAHHRIDFLNKHSYNKSSTGMAPAFDKDKNFIGMIECNDPRWKISIFGINHWNNLQKWLRAGQETHHLNALKGEHVQQLRIKNGLHHWLNQDNQHIKDMVAAGTHHWLSKEHKNKTGLRTKKDIKNKNHPFGKLTKCPHCNKEGQLAAMKRWHFDNCRIIVPS